MKNKLKEIKGVYTALVTPVINGNVDEVAFKKLIDFQLKNGADGFLVLGGTGEYAALSREQRRKAIEICIDIVKGEIPIVSGILSPGLADAIEMGKVAESIGVDAVMIITPYYVVPTQKGLIDYFIKFMEKIHIPIVLYNIPYRTNVNILPETFTELVDKTSQIIGIKECTPDLSQVSHLISLVGDKISVCCGEEPFLFTELIMGAKGAFMATSNLFPKLFKKMYLKVKNGDISKAREIHFKLIPLLESIFAETNPGPLKEALKYYGYDCGSALPPLKSPNRGIIKKLEKRIDDLDKFLKTMN